MKRSRGLGEADARQNYLFRDVNSTVGLGQTEHLVYGYQWKARTLT